MSKLIELADGVVVEIESAPGEVQRAGALPDKVQRNLEGVRDLATTVVKSTFADFAKFGDAVGVESLEIEFGISFGVEGNVYLAKASSTANLTVKVTLVQRSTT